MKWSMEIVNGGYCLYSLLSAASAPWWRRRAHRVDAAPLAQPHQRRRRRNRRSRAPSDLRLTPAPRTPVTTSHPASAHRQHTRMRRVFARSTRCWHNYRELEPFLSPELSMLIIIYDRKYIILILHNNYIHIHLTIVIVILFSHS